VLLTERKVGGRNYDGLVESGTQPRPGILETLPTRVTPGRVLFPQKKNAFKSKKNVGAEVADSEIIEKWKKQGRSPGTRGNVYREKAPET